jgi:photosystem II stability/assembly factor-like uncharacterized protein
MRPTRPPLPRPPLATIALLAMALAAAPLAAAPKPAIDPALLKDLPWREVGPYRGGRSAAVTGVASQPLTYYFGGTGGGVWKSIDGGSSWQNVSDGFFGGSIGSVAVSEWDPNVVYAGGGEVTVRGNVSPGSGIWRSTDAGKTWSFAGLADSQHVPRLRIHPKDPDLVYAAVLGHAFGASDVRGVYRSKDGGKSWQRVLFAGPDAGAVDLAMDPGNPRVLYASTWRMRRSPWGFESGGPGSGLWKSTDGGDTWKELTHKKGLPQGTVGIIGVDISRSNPQNIYAIVEAADGGVFRSKDGGETWEKTNDDRALRQRAWYYTRIYADPADEDVVYVVNVQFHRSKDGGKTFTKIPTPHGDNHDLWIAPGDPKRMIEANDGGVNVTTDGGANWTKQDNQPTAQIYRVTTDSSFPYRLLGAQQDNSALRIRHRAATPGAAGIGPSDWEPTAGGESGHVVADPRDPEVVYGGSYGGYLTRLDHRTGEIRDVNPWPDNPMGWGAADLKYRFQWNFPIFFSAHDPSVLYAAANVLFRSRDGGQSWEVASPDLTRNDKTKMGPSGGPITKDNTSVEYYGTIFAGAESPLEAGVLWAGSDDGLVHVSRDSGKTWTNVTPKGCPEWILVNSIEPSPFEKGGLYLAATRYKLDDFRPYLYKTADYGATWKRIDVGLPEGAFTRVVRADPARRGLLYAGTERGVFVSFDDGGSWQSLQGKLPIVPVTDLAVRGDDLIAATQGRGFWMLDDLAPLRQAEVGGGGDREAASGPFRLYTPEPAWRIGGAGDDDDDSPPRNQGANPPAGVELAYLLRDPQPGTELKLELLGADGKVLREFKGKVEAAKDKEKEKEKERKGEGEEKKGAEKSGGKGAAKGAEPEAGSPAQAEPTRQPASGPGAAGEETEPEGTEASEAAKKKKKEEPKLPAEPGLNRFAWDLRLKEAEDFEGLVLWGGDQTGPRVPPGRYQARLTVAGQSQTVPFEVKADPRSKATPADLKAQYDFLVAVRDKLSQVHGEIAHVRDVRRQLADLRKRVGSGEDGKAVRDAARELDRKMTAVEEALYQTKNRSPQDPLNFPIRLNNKLASVADTAGTGDGAPSAQAEQVRRELTAAIDAELAKLKAIWETDLPALNKLAAETPAVVVPKPAS